MADEKKPAAAAAAKEAPKQPAAAAEAPAPFVDKNRNLLTVIIVGSLMMVEGVGIVIAVKMFGGGPATTQAADGIGADGGLVDENGNPLPTESEVAVIDLMAYNNKSGYMYVFQINVQALVATEYMKKVSGLIESRKQTIRDRFSRIIRAADPKYFEEPGLETVRRQFKYELEQVLNDKTLVKEILLPEFNQSRAD